MKKAGGSAAGGSGTIYPFHAPKGNRNEGFTSSSKVNYVARCGTFAGSPYSYTGALRILKVMLSYDYLWINIRVKGGAYGCMSSVGRSGEGYFVSYRDPNVKETDRIYEGIPEYLEQFDADERDMTKYVIGTISDLDTPLTPVLKGSERAVRLVLRRYRRDAEKGAGRDTKRKAGGYPGVSRNRAGNFKNRCALRNRKRGGHEKGSGVIWRTSAVI